MIALRPYFKIEMLASELEEQIFKMVVGGGGGGFSFFILITSFMDQPMQIQTDPCFGT